VPGVSGADVECGDKRCCLSLGHDGRHYRPWSRERRLLALWRRTGSLYTDDYAADEYDVVAEARRSTVWRERRAEQVGRWIAVWGSAVR
jgi:hypothetical protein